MRTNIQFYTCIRNTKNLTFKFLKELVSWKTRSCSNTVRINFGYEGVSIQEAVGLVQNEIVGLRSIDYEVPRALTIELQKLAGKFGDNIRVRHIEIGVEQYTTFPWTAEKVEMIGHVPFEIELKHGDSTRVIRGMIRIGGKLITKREIDDVETIYRHMSSFSYRIVNEFLKNRGIVSFKIDNKDTQNFIDFLTEKLFYKATELAAQYPWYFWFWEGIHQFSSVQRLHACTVPSQIAKKFYITLGLIQSKYNGSQDIDPSMEEYLRKANSKDFRKTKTQIYYICQEWNYLSGLRDISKNFAGLRIIFPADLESFTFQRFVVPFTDFHKKGMDLDFMRALRLNVQRSGFSGGYPRGFSWFVIRTYVNMLLSHFDPGYMPGPPKRIPLHQLARAFLPIRKNLLKDYGIEVEHLICLVGAYLNFFNDWLKKSIQENPDFIPFFTLDKSSLADVDRILNLNMHLQALKKSFAKGSLPKKYDKAKIPKDWSKVVRKIHDSFSLNKHDVETLDVSKIEKPFLFYEFSDGQYVVCCIDLLLGLDHILQFYRISGEYGRVKGRIFEEFSAFVPSRHEWLSGQNVKIEELVGRKLGTDIDVIFLKPPIVVVGSCKTEGGEKIFEINDEKKAFARWDELKGYLRDIDEMAEWLGKNLEREDIKIKIYNSMKPGSQELSLSVLEQLLSKVKYIIPVVITPGIEFILDLSDQYMLADWIPRVCTPKELLLYLNEVVPESVEQKVFVIKTTETPPKAVSKKTLREKINWKFEDVWTRPILVIRKDEEASELDIVDMSNGLPCSIEVPEEFPMEELDLGETYIARIEVYIARLTDEIEKGYLKLAEKNKSFREMLELAKRIGAYGHLFKFRLVDVISPPQPMSEKREKTPILYQPMFRKPITPKTVNEWNKKHPERPTTLEYAPKTRRTCKVCKQNFLRTDEELIKFLQPIYPTNKVERAMTIALIERRVGDPFLCSKCYSKRLRPK